MAKLKHGNPKRKSARDDVPQAGEEIRGHRSRIRARRWKRTAQQPCATRPGIQAVRRARRCRSEKVNIRLRLLSSSSRVGGLENTVLRTFRSSICAEISDRSESAAVPSGAGAFPPCDKPLRSAGCQEDRGSWTAIRHRTNAPRTRWWCGRGERGPPLAQPGEEYTVIRGEPARGGRHEDARRPVPDLRRLPQEPVRS